MGELLDRPERVRPRMPTWEEKIFTLYDDFTHRIRHCCGELDWTPVSGSCGTCRLDGQVRASLGRYIEANGMKRPASLPAPLRLEIVQPLPSESKGSGIPPLSPEERDDFHRKLQGASAKRRETRRSA